MVLARLVYKLTSNFPKYELYGLCSQMRRAVFRFHQMLLRVILGQVEKNLEDIMKLRTVHYLKLKLSAC